MELLKNEKRLNKLINKIDNENSYKPQSREKTLLEVLQYVSSISQDGNLDKLLNVIKENFKEYGG